MRDPVPFLPATCGLKACRPATSRALFMVVTLNSLSLHHHLSYPFRTAQSWVGLKDSDTIYIKLNIQIFIYEI